MKDFSHNRYIMRVKNFEHFNKLSKYNIFVRWGGANAVRQNKECDNSPTSYHYPPDSRGIYAFPIKAIETFLSGHRMKERYSHIKYDGEVWHHLTEHVKPSEVLKRHNSWCLTSHKTWEKAFRKEMMSMKLKGWKGKINNDMDNIGMMTYYWKYYMRHKYRNIDNKTYDHYKNLEQTSPLEFARIMRYRNNIAPTKEDLTDPDFLEKSKGIDNDKDYFTSYKDFTSGKSSMIVGGYSKDHLEVFLPNVS